ncbi:MAG: cupin domain-containing protein [Deltaproteobacteria bacterium]|nr:cupin domain-containing protein [Deltaproteobacteria bacterium]
MQAINLADKLSTFDEVYVPKVVAELNGQLVKIAKFHGTFPWHSHADEDEMFLVLEGRFDLEFRDRTVTVSKGEFCVVPRGVEHRPVAAEVASVMLFEPATVRNTGDVVNERTIEAEGLERL